MWKHLSSILNLAAVITLHPLITSWSFFPVTTKSVHVLVDRKLDEKCTEHTHLINIRWLIVLLFEESTGYQFLDIAVGLCYNHFIKVWKPEEIQPNSWMSVISINIFQRTIIPHILTES